MDKVGIPSGKVGLWSVGQTSSYMVICADFFKLLAEIHFLIVTLLHDAA